MYLLIIGLFVFMIPHIMLGLTPALTNNIKSKIPANTYKITFSLIILSSIILMVFGYRSILPDEIYEPIATLAIPGKILMLFAFILFAAAKSQNNIKRVLRHPQLTAVILWAISHLILMGDFRVTILFGSLLAWAIIEMILINRREGKRAVPVALPFSKDLKTILVGTVVFAVFLFLHPYIFGVDAIPAYL